MRFIVLIVWVLTSFAMAESIAAMKEKCESNPAYCHNLAVGYYNEGEDQNLSLSYKYFKKACDMEFLQSCFNIGLMSLNATGVNRDEFLAFDMFKKSCIKGKKGYEMSDGCRNLAMLYIEGIGVRQDFAKGVEILENTCKAGVLQNCKSLATIYKDGYLGIEADSAKS